MTFSTSSSGSDAKQSTAGPNLMTSNDPMESNVNNPEQPTQQFPSVQPPKKKRKGLKIAGIAGAVVVAAVVIGSVAGNTNGTTPAGTSTQQPPDIGPFTPSQHSTVTVPQVSDEPASSEAPAPAEDVWEFSVTTTGSGIGSVTYMKPGFNIAQDTSPRGKSWSMKIEGDYDIPPNMNAQNKGSGTISCKITHNGEVVSENSSKGAYAVVSCQ